MREGYHTTPNIGDCSPQQPFWGFNVRPQWQDIPHTLSGICNISIRWLSHRTVGTGKSVQVLGLSPKRTGLGVPHGSSSIAAGAVNKTKREKFWRLQKRWERHSWG